MEEQGFQWAEEMPPPTPPENYGLGQLVENLRRFGEEYQLAEAQIREENPITAKQSRIQLGAHVSGARACLLTIPGFAELRAWARSEWDEEVSFAVGRRIVDALVERSDGRLSVNAAETLSLTEAVRHLSAPPDEVLEKGEVRLSGNELPAPIDRETRQRIIDELERWKRILYAPPAEKPTLPEHVELTTRIVAWRDRHAPRFDVTSLDEVRRILQRRATGELTPEEELRTAGERAARTCDRITGWLQSTETALDMSGFTLALVTYQAVSSIYDEDRGRYRDLVRTYRARVVATAAELGLCSFEATSDAAGRALINWLVANHDFDYESARNLPVDEVFSIARRTKNQPPKNPTCPRPGIVIFTVNEHETRAVHDAFREVTGTDGLPVSLEGRLYHKFGTLNDTTVYHAISEMGSGGPGAMQQAVDKAIRALDPRVVIAVGIAFGVNAKDQSTGDILLSKQLRLYDLQRAGAEIVLRGDKPHASSRLINHFEGFSQIKWKGAKVRPGVILSGDKLIDSIDYRDQLLKLEVEAVGGEMEGAGLYVSSHDHKVDWIVIKAICDWADGNKRKNKTQRQKKAARNAAQFLVQALQYAPLNPHR